MTPAQRRLAALRTKTFLLEERKDVASAKSVVQTAIMAKMDAAGTGTPLPEDGKMPKNEPGWIWFAEGRHLYRFQVGEFPLYAELQSRRGHVGPLERDLLDQVRAEGLLAQALLEQYVSEGK